MRATIAKGTQLKARKPRKLVKCACAQCRKRKTKCSGHGPFANPVVYAAWDVLGISQTALSGMRTLRRKSLRQIYGAMTLASWLAPCAMALTKNRRCYSQSFAWVFRLTIWSSQYARIRRHWQWLHATTNEEVLLARGRVRGVVPRNTECLYCTTFALSTHLPVRYLNRQASQNAIDSMRCILLYYSGAPLKSMIPQEISKLRSCAKTIFMFDTMTIRG